MPKAWVLKRLIGYLLHQSSREILCNQPWID
jgi:hypothetical protein